METHVLSLAGGGCDLPRRLVGHSPQGSHPERAGRPTANEDPRGLGTPLGGFFTCVVRCRCGAPGAQAAALPAVGRPTAPPHRGATFGCASPAARWGNVTHEALTHRAASRVTEGPIELASTWWLSPPVVDYHTGPTLAVG